MPVPKPIAIVGVSALFPGSLDNRGFWRDILSGRDLIGKVPPSHWLIDDYYDPDIFADDKTYSDRGAFLDAVDFAPMDYGVPPNILAATDSAQLLAMFVAKTVLDEAFNGGFEEADRSRTGVILGVASTTELCAHMAGRLQQPVWEEGLRRSGLTPEEVETISKNITDMYVPWQESTFPGLLGNVVSGRVANRFDLGGTNCVIDAACASSLAALEMGVNQLSLGQADMMITGGVDTLNDILMYMCFSKTGALSKTGDCRPFSNDADGTMMAEGIGMFALKRLEDAERDGNSIYAVIQGVGSSSDGRAKSIYAPRPQGQSKALNRAYEDAGYGPETVELVEAHGTATVAGDAAEVSGLKAVFGPNDDMEKRWCALGSVKSQIGHAKAAAGAAGFFKTVLSLNHRILPPTIKVDKPNPDLGLDESPFYVNTEARPWIRGSDHPRRNGVSAFGFGGTNFHVTLEEYTGPGKMAPRQRTLTHELIALSADTPEALIAEARKLAEEISEDPKKSAGLLHFLAKNTQENFVSSRPARLTLVATDEADLKKKLQQAAKTIEGAPKDAFSTPGGVHYGFDVDPADVAFLFPGQGSQYVAMGAEWAMHFDSAREVWDRSADIDFDPDKKLHQVVFPPPAFSDEEADAQRARLTATEWAQPALGATSLSALALLKEMGLTPSCAAGHSYGEITALAAAGVLDETSMLKISRKRGELMANASDVAGAMTAVRCTIEDIEAHLKEWDVDVVVANHNSPHQCVLSGAEDAVDQVEKHLQKESIPFTRLSVSTAFHSSLVSGSSAPFLEFLNDIDFNKADFPVYANSLADTYPEKAGEMREVLAGQLAKPVRFVEQIQAIYDSGVRTFVEVGPHSTLTGLVGKCLADKPHHRINTDRRGKNAVESLFGAIGFLASRGVELDFAPLWKNYATLEDPRAAKDAGFTVEIGGANYGKPYPSEDPRPTPKPRLKPQSLIDEIRRELPAPAPIAAKVSTPMTDQNNNQNRSIAANGTAHTNGTTNGVATNGVATNGAAQPQQAQASNTWVDAFREQQRETARAHRTYQETTAEAHRAFLDTMNTSFHALGHIAGGKAAENGAPLAPSFAPPTPARPPQQTNGSIRQPAYTSPAPAPSSYAPAPTANGVAQPPVASYQPAPVAPSQPVAQAAAPAAPAPVAPTPAPAAPAPAPATPAAAEVDVLDILLKVVADKTGYPTEMLEPSMELESDLGVDSIKQVEIMAQMEEEIPELPEVEASDLAELRTLQAIGDHLISLLGGSASAVNGAAAPATPAAPAAPAAVATEQTDADVEAILLEVVADKTGYPAEMLEPTMQLEADLGVDSIKQVEIMAQMEERLPDLPEVEASVLADLRTLRDIAVHLEGLMTGRAPRTQSSTTEEESDDDSESGQPAAGIARYRVYPAVSPACGWAMPGLHAIETLYVVSNGGALGQKLVDELSTRGVNAELVEEAPSSADSAIFIDALRAVEDLEEATDINRRAIMCARALTEGDTAPRFFVTVQNTGGAFTSTDGSIERAWTAGVGALAKTAAAEWPEASVKCIDLAIDGLSPAQQATAIADELFFGGPEVEVGIDTNGLRITPVATPEEVARGAAFEGLAKDSVLVVSGGAKGVTATSIIELAKELPLRFVLLGRTELTEEPAACSGVTDDAKLKQVLLAEAKRSGTPLTPKKLQRQARQISSCREIRATIKALEDAGSQARYASADVTDAPRIKEICDEVREDWGAINGFIHGAGVLADSLISKKTEDQFNFVFNTKIRGLQALLDATKDDDLTTICLFSSVAARSGNPGQSDYAMANEVLNKIGHAEAKRRGPSCRVKSLGWGPWDGGMVTPALKAHFESEGVVLLPETKGGQMLVDELLYAPNEDVELVLGGAVSAEGINGSHLTRGIQADIVVSPETLPYLDSHRLRDIPVVPAMLAIEWFTRFAAASCPHLFVKCCRDLVVRKGIQVDDFEEGTHRLTIKAVSTGEGDFPVLNMELVGPGDTVHYVAVVEMSDEPNEAPSTLAKEYDLKLPESPWKVDEVYEEGRLFHGPQFHVLTDLKSLGEGGGVAALKGLKQMDWPEEDWSSDPAAMDGALQVSLLWGLDLLGAQTLPMRVANFIPFVDEPSDEPLVCYVRRKKHNRKQIVADVLLTTEAGNPLCELHGVEMFAVPDGV